MKLGAILLLILCFAPVMKPAALLAHLAILPIMNAFFLTLNPVSYPEAYAGCLEKGMFLAEFGRTDIGSAFGIPGSQAWIYSWDGLWAGEFDPEGPAKAITVKFVGLPTSMKFKRSSLMSAFPSSEDVRMSLPYICQPMNIPNLF